MTSRIFRRSTFVLLLSGCVATLLAVPSAGCESDPAASDGDGGDGGAGGTAGTGGVAGMNGSGGTVPLTVQVFEAESISSSDLGPGLEGVEVCEDGTDNCELTDESGSATIMLPAGRAIGYTMTKEGHISYLVWDVTDDTFGGLSSNWPMFTESQIEEIAIHLMIDYPLQGSWLVFGAVPFRAGATFELVGETAKSFYNDDDGVPQLDHAETTSDGRGGFVDLDEGEHEVEFGGAATNCTPSIAWNDETPNRIRVVLRAGFHTYASMTCDTP
jgi:hypothetical protein